MNVKQTILEQHKTLERVRQLQKEMHEICMFSAGLEALENSETNQDKEKMQEENEMIETYELVINGEIVFFDKENSALDLLKKIKEQTNIEVEVFETIKEQLI
jgi:hypothetical protein